MVCRSIPDIEIEGMIDERRKELRLNLNTSALVTEAKLPDESKNSHRLAIERKLRDIKAADAMRLKRKRSKSPIGIKSIKY